MRPKLTWNDLVIENIPESDARTWLGYWSGAVNGKVAPVFMSKFGDWFLRRPDGSTDELSVIDLSYKTIAGTPDEFTTLVNSPTWQEVHLLSLVLYDLHERGMTPKAGQCYGFAPHPVWTGTVEVKHARLMDINAWQFICAQEFNKHKSAN